MALTFEQYKKLKEAGYTPEKIAELEKRRTSEKAKAQAVTTTEPNKTENGFLSGVASFLGDTAKSIVKPIAQSVVAPAQAIQTIRNVISAPKEAEVKSQTDETTRLYKRAKELESQGQQNSEEYKQIMDTFKESSEKELPKTYKTTVNAGVLGELEAPKTFKEVAGTGLETIAAGLGGAGGKVASTAGKSLIKRIVTGPGAKIGAAYGAGEELKENKSLVDVAKGAALGAGTGALFDVALLKGGQGLKKLGEKIQKPTTETKLSLGEKAASSIINSLIKPLKKDFAYGKNPGLSVAREKITANSWDDLVTKIGKAKTKTGKEIGSFYKDNVDGKTTVNLSNSLKSIDETIKKAASENNQSVINRLEDVKNAITKKLVPAKDEAGKTIIKTAGKKRLYNIKPSNAQSIIEKIGGMTKFTGNVSDDNMVNKALKKVYGSARNELESSIKKVDESLYSKIRQLNEHYGNITSADIAAKNREMIVQRANLMGLAPEVISGTSIVGGLVSGNPIAIIGGIMTAMGNQAMKSPAIKTRLASILAGASNKERISIFAKYPALKSLKENIGVGVSKTGEVISKIPGIAEEAPRKSVQSLMEVARTKMPIGMTIKDVSKEGFSKAGVPQKLEQEARKYKSAEEFVNVIKTKHRPPDADGGKPLNDLEEIFPDIYSPQGDRYYASYGMAGEKQAMQVIRKMKDKPEEEITIYRSVNPDEKSTISAGDWVTIVKDYAKQHGESNLEKGFKIISKKVKSSDILNDGNSVVEWGYRPEGHKDFTRTELTDIWNKANEGIKETPYKETGSLTTKLLKKLEGKTTVNKQFISDLTNSPDLKQTEKDLIRAALKGEDSKINVAKFADKVKAELLPLKMESSAGGEPRYENIVLPNEQRGPIANYEEHVYNSPIKTSAGQVHFGDEGSQNYFGHTRVEDLPGPQTKRLSSGNIVREPSTTRRIIEVQSDLYQKGRLEKEFDRAGRIDGSMANKQLTVESAQESLDKYQTALDNWRQGKRKMSELSDDPYFYADSEEMLVKRVDDWEKLLAEAKSGKIDARKADLSKLQQYSNPTAHFRMVREEIKKAAEDGKAKLQFPTGETAMKIEGLVDTTQWSFRDDMLYNHKLTSDKLKVGQEIQQGAGNELLQRNNLDDRGSWIITDVLGDGKFKAVPKSSVESPYSDWKEMMRLNPQLENLKETFDILGKVDTSNPIYKFYEKEMGKYLKSKYNAKEIIDDQGVSWYEVDIKPDMKGSIEAFGMGAIPLATQINQDKK